MTPWIATQQASLSITISQSFVKLMSIVLVMLPHPLHPPSPFVFHLSQHQGLLLIRRPEYWSFSFSFSTSPSNEYSGLISFRIDWFYLLAVQGDKDSQESSPTAQLKSVNSSVLSLLYGPTLTSICDYWKNHTFNYMEFCQQLKS